MIVGIGTDIVKIERMQASLDRFGERFAQKILSDAELQELPNQHSAAHFLAKRFAAKEATVKALGTGIKQGVSFKHITVSHDSHGKPILVLTGKAADIAKQLHINNTHISISDEQDNAIAMVIFEK